MLESLQTDRVNVTDLALAPAPKPRGTFDADIFLTTNDLRDLNRLLDQFRQRLTSPYQRASFRNDFRDFSRLVVTASILAPGQQRREKNDHAFWPKMKAEMDFLYRAEVIGSRDAKWEDNLTHLAAMKTLFPDKKGELELEDGLQEVTANRMITLVRTISEHEEPTRAFLSAGILFPAVVPEFRTVVRMVADDGYWERMQMWIRGLRLGIGGYPQSEIVEKSLLLRLLYPERTAELNLDKISIPRFKAELRDPTPGSTLLDFYRRVAAAKLLFADDIQFTEKGIVAVYEKPSLADTAPNIPEVRRF